MHILLLILKIIGIGLLVLLGLLLVLILLLLFVPFVYRAEGTFYENKPYVMVRIRYLFPLLNIFLKYQENELEGKVKVFGFTAHDFFSQDEKQKVKVKHSQSEKPSQIIAEKTSSEMSSSEKGIPIKENLQTEEKEEKITLWEKICLFIRTLKEKILAFIRKLKTIRDKGFEIKEKVSFYYELWQRESTQRAFQTAKKTLFKVWKSIRPKKGLVKFHFGTGDPGSTGQMCGYFGMLYPFVGKYVMIEPDFENKIYEGDFYFKGRITMFVFLKAAWTLLFDKDIKEIRKILMDS